jgi:hypothetical protein
MRTRPANWMIAASLMLQLAMGSQWQVAHAVVVPAQRQVSAMDAGHCPGHAGASSGAPSSHGNPASKHDCCRSQGCQCHSAQSPVLLDLPWTSADFALPLPRVVDARRPVTRTTEFFRPPIA